MKTLSNTLKQEFARWDGKSSDVLQSLASKHGKDVDFIETLLELAAQAKFEAAASWLIKASIQAGSKLNEAQAHRFLKLLPAFTNWQSKIHILQCLHLFRIPPDLKNDIVACLRAGLLDQNKFLRAWTYHGWVVLADQYPEYQDEVRQFVKLALRDEPASVKARIRNLPPVAFL